MRIPSIFHAPVFLILMMCWWSTAHSALPPEYSGKPFADSFHKTGPAGIPGIVQCALYDLGGQGIAFNDTTAANEGSDRLNRQTTPHNHQRAHAGEYIWHFRSGESVDVSFVKDWADLNHTNSVAPPINQFYIGWTEDGEWVNYTVNVREPGAYSVKALYSQVDKDLTRGPDGEPSAPVSFQVNGEIPVICRIPRSTAGYHHWDFAKIGTVVFKQAGLNLLKFRYRKGNNWAFFVFEKENAG